MRLALILLVFGFLLSNGLWLLIWRRTIKFSTQKRSSLKRSMTLLDNQFKDQTRQFQDQTQQLKNLKTELLIISMEKDKNIESLVNIVTENVTPFFKKGTKYELAENALSRLGYQRIYHQEESHFREWTTEEEVYNDCGGSCNSQDSQGNCCNPFCIQSGGTSYTDITTHREKIIDKPAYVEVVRQS